MKIILPVLVLVVVLSARMAQLNKDQKAARILGIQIQRDEDIKRLSQLRDYWEKIASDSPTFRDAYVQLAISNWQLGATEEAKLNVERALEIDPNWVVPDQLQPLLQ